MMGADRGPGGGRPASARSGPRPGDRAPRHRARTNRCAGADRRTRRDDPPRRPMGCAPPRRHAGPCAPSPRLSQFPYRRSAAGRQRARRPCSSATTGSSASSSSRRSASARVRSSVSMLRRGVVEIAVRQVRADLPFAAQEAGEVAAIFAEQAQGVVFGMTLQEDEQAAALPGEHVDARLRGAREHLVAARAQARPRAARSSANAAPRRAPAPRSADDRRRSRNRTRRSICPPADAARCRRGAARPHARRGTTTPSTPCWPRPSRSARRASASRARCAARPRAARCR